MRIKSLEKILNKKYCYLTKNGCTALYILIKSLNIKNKIILMPANICYDVVLVVLFSGNYPEILDIDRNQCLSYKSLINFKKIRNVGAMIYPYMYGNYGDVFKIKKFSDKKNFHFIEDIAPSLGAKINRKYVGSITEYSFASFGKGKIVDLKLGGSVNVNSTELFNQIKKQYLKLKKTSRTFDKKNKILNRICLKILERKKNKSNFSKKKLIKFKDTFLCRREFNKKYLSNLNKKIFNIDKINYFRKKKANLFQKLIKNKNIRFIRHKKGAAYWRQNAILKSDRNELIKYLNSKNIYARKYFPCLDNIFPFFKKSKLHLTKKFELGLINFWVGSETSEKEIKKINNHINSFYI